MLEFIVPAILVFLAVCLADVFWTRYIQATGEGKALAAAIFSALIILVGNYTSVSIYTDHWKVIPAALGAFVGTYFVVRLHKHHY